MNGRVGWDRMGWMGSLGWRDADACMNELMDELMDGERREERLEENEATNI